GARTRAREQGRVATRRIACQTHRSARVIRRALSLGPPSRRCRRLCVDPHRQASLRFAEQLPTSWRWHVPSSRARRRCYASVTMHPARKILQAPPGDQRVHLYGVSWREYEALLAMRGESSGVRISYLKGVVELMAPSNEHEVDKKRLARLIEAWS